MRNTIPTICLILVLGWGLAAPAFAQTGPDEGLFQEAKLLLFDKKWSAALGKLEDLLGAYPKSPYFGQAIFYKGECLRSLPGREAEALGTYKDYVRLPNANPNLAESAQTAIIDLGFALYEKGDRAALVEVESRLNHPNKAVRYYAAYKLSLVKDRAVAAKAVPLLEQIIRTEKDPELTDRARIALLHVSPESLKSVEDRRPAGDAPRMLHIRIMERGKKDRVELNIPWALADLALSAMDEEDKASLRAKGYDVGKIMSDLNRSRGTILRIEGGDGSVFEIWID